MEKESLLLKIDLLEQKLKKLLEGHKELKNELIDSREENKRLRNTIEKQNEEIKNFQNQDKISKIVASITEDAQSSYELKIKINEYIKEIDKCIAYLSE